MKKKNRQNDMENTRKHVRGTNSPSYGKDNSVREWEKSRDYENYWFSTKELALYLMQGSFLALELIICFIKVYGQQLYFCLSQLFTFAGSEKGWQRSEERL